MVYPRCVYQKELQKPTEIIKVACEKLYTKSCVKQKSLNGFFSLSLSKIESTS